MGVVTIKTCVYVRLFKTVKKDTRNFLRVENSTFKVIVYNNAMHIVHSNDRVPYMPPIHVSTFTCATCQYMYIQCQHGRLGDYAASM